MDSKSGKKPVLKILSLQDSPMDSELIYEYLCEISFTKFKRILFQRYEN